MSGKIERAPLIYGHRSKGTIRFGHLHMGSKKGTLESDCESGVMLQAKDSRHYMTMDIDGPREGWTLNRCPGTYQIKCATNVDARSIGYLLEVDNGDIVLNAKNGNVRIYGVNVDIFAKTGTDPKNGVINIESNQAVNIETGQFEVRAKAGIKLLTPYTMDLAANTALNFTSNFIDGLSSASSFKPNKANPTTIAKYLTRQRYG